MDSALTRVLDRRPSVLEISRSLSTDCRLLITHTPVAAIQQVQIRAGGFTKPDAGSVVGSCRATHPTHPPPAFFPESKVFPGIKDDTLAACAGTGC